MNKNSFAVTPPMGWNSWDCYGASVTEADLLRNATYIAKHLKPYGWEYVVCDIQWSEPTADSTAYHPFAELCMDEYGRLLPAPNRFPSAANGAGFKPIADRIHAMGLKFGIHLMRGIPRQAVARNVPIKNATVHARDIAHTASISAWQTDMYGLNPAAVGAQAYYDSLFELYAEWGVDFVKVDDLCIIYRTATHDIMGKDFDFSGKEEIEMYARAIQHCGRDIVLSLSPGPAMVEHAEHYRKHANMWRITNDLWDRWDDIVKMFDRCRTWSPYVSEGCFPDCDMLPLGHISIRGCEHGQFERQCLLTHAEQRTMMTLWSIFRSPMMLGCELTDLDDWTKSLITNQEVLNLLKNSRNAREIMNICDTIVWQAEDERGNTYVAVFNTGSTPAAREITLDKLELSGSYTLRNLWEQKDEGIVTTSVICTIDVHDAVLYQLTPVI